MICIIWAIGYWFFYPAWPTFEGNTKGSLNWSQQSQLAESQAEINAIKQVRSDKIEKLSFKQIQKDPELMEFAIRGGKASFKENCAACHGTGAQGFTGYPNLNDDDWIWGGKITDIYQTILYGIRSVHDKTRYSVMPAFGRDKILTKKEIESVSEYVLSLADRGKYNLKGRKIFVANCASCHGIKGKGDRSVGAPNLADSIWLYGKNKSDIIHMINEAPVGVMPYWTGRLDETTIKQLAIYVHSLGGGE